MAMQLHGTPTKYTCLSSTLYTSLLVLGGEAPCDLTQVVSDTPGGTSASGKTITTFYESTQLDSGEPNTLGFSNTLSNFIPYVSNYLLLWGTSSLKRRETRSQTC
jgi:hypothetical protein